MIQLHRITVPSARMAANLAAILTLEGWPNTVWFMCATTGKPVVVTMAPACTVRSCIESAS